MRHCNSTVNRHRGMLVSGSGRSTGPPTSAYLVTNRPGICRPVLDSNDRARNTISQGLEPVPAHASIINTARSATLPNVPPPTRETRTYSPGSSCGSLLATSRPSSPERYSITRPTLSGAITESAIDPPEVHHIVAEPVRRVRVILRQPLNLIVAIGQRYKVAMVNRCRRRENLNVYDRTVTAHNLRLIRGRHRPRKHRPIERLPVPVNRRAPILADNLMRPTLEGKRRLEKH